MFLVVVWLGAVCKVKVRETSFPLRLRVTNTKQKMYTYGIEPPRFKQTQGSMLRWC